MPETEPPALPMVLVKPFPILFGTLAGLGVAVLLQQYAVTPLTVMLLVGMGIAGALVIGIGLPTIMFHVMRRRPAAAPEEGSE